MENKYKYNAFISYRHISPDKEIADKLQKKLENYKPPRSLLNGKRFGGWRVFRDETELPTSSNLSSDIKAALEKSEYLIVICSKTTGESRWCMEEVEYFKQLHNGNNSNIITLVADGNPKEVFPPSLCNELIPVTDEKGNTTYQNHIIEPLAANVSGKNLKESLKKLNTEFLRIAAPILGCGYDNLYNREHKKKIRRIFTVGGIILSLLLLFVIYNSAMLWQINNQKVALAAANEDLAKKTEEVEDNLVEANKQKKAANEANRNLRIKNSEILVNQAQIYLDNGDIFSAISAALEALPQDGEDFPSSAVAEYVLATATNAYGSSDKMVNYAINLASYVDFLDFSEDGTRLLSNDTMGNIYVIDYEKNKIIKAYTPIEAFGETSNLIYDIVVDGNDGLALCSGQLISIDLKDGNIKWHYNDKYEDGYIAGSEIVTNSSSDYIFLPDTSSYTVLTKDGQKVLSVGYYEDENYDYNSINDYVHMSANGTVYIVRPESSDIHLLNQNINKIYPVEIAENDEVIFVGENDDCIFLNIGVSVEGNTFVGYNNARMICLNKNDMSVKWSTDYTVESPLYNTSYNTMFEFTHNLPNENDEYQKHTGILTVSGMHILCFDKQTGELYYSADEDPGVSILYCAPNTTEYSIRIATSEMLVTKVYLARNIDPDIFGGEAGDHLLYTYTDGYYFDKERKFAAHSGNDKLALASEYSSEINLYHNTSFENHNTFVNYPDVKGNLDFIVDDGNGIFAAYYYNYVDNVKEKHIVIYDAKNDICKAFFKEDLEVDTMILKSNKLLMFDSSGNSKVMDYSGQILEEFNLKEKINAAAGFNSSNYIPLYNAYIHLSENNIILCISNGIYTINLSKENVVVKKVLSGDNNLDNYYITDDFVSFTVDSYKDYNTKIAYFKDGDKQFSYLSENGNTVEFIRDSISSVVNTSVGNKIAFISLKGYIGVYSCGGNSIMKISFPQDEVKPLSIKFTPDGDALIAMCANGKFIKYSIETGEILGEYKIETTVTASTMFEFMDEHSFYIRSAIDEIFIIDLDSMQKLAVIKNFIRYMQSEKIIICSRYIDSQHEPIYYNYLTTSELINLAKKFLENK